MTKRTIKIIIVILITIIALVLGIFIVPQASISLAANFSDVPTNSRYAPAIQSLRDANILIGYPDGNFLPDQNITRAETVAIILKARGITTVKTSERIPFTDVPEDAWFFPMIQKGVNLGRLRGYPDRTFKPSNPITMPEAIALTLAFYQVGVSSINVERTIYDGLNVNDWYAKMMQYAKNKNIIEPDENGRIHPASPLKRGELAEIIYRMRTVAETNRPYDLTVGWLSAEHPDNFWKIKYPSGWQLFKGLKNSAIWRQDPQLGTSHAFFTRVWPASARVSMSLFENPDNLTAAQYFAQLKNIYEKTHTRVKTRSAQITISGRPAMKISVPDKRLMDIIISLPNRKFLIMYGEYGEAPIGEFLKKQIEALEMSYEYVERPAAPPQPTIPLADRMQTLRENILVASKWNEITGLFPDKRLVRTDAIGVGTGPVDYYYSREANHTIKLERNSGTILNIREGQTDAF